MEVVLTLGTASFDSYFLSISSLQVMLPMGYTVIGIGIFYHTAKVLTGFHGQSSSSLEVVQKIFLFP